MKLNEYQEQVLFVEYLDILKNQGKIVMFTAVNPRPNMEHMGQRMKAKRAGLNPGFPDLIILTKKKAICIEMKAGQNRLSEEQDKWQVALNKVGIETWTTWGFQAAKDVINSEL